MPCIVVHPEKKSFNRPGISLFVWASRNLFYISLTLLPKYEVHLYSIGGCFVQYPTQKSAMNENHRLACAGSEGARHATNRNRFRVIHLTTPELQHLPGMYKNCL